MNNFTPRAQQVLAHARREADRFNHHYIGTEHLLLGLLKLGKGVAVTILENLGVELTAVRRQVEEQIGRGTEPQAEGNIPYTPRVRKVLAMANREAQELNHTYVGTEHLLLGLIRDGDGVAGQILRHFGVDLEQARRELLDVLTPKYQMDADEDNIIPDDDDDEDDEDDEAVYEITCDGCGETFYLDEDEVAQGSYVCPSCGKTLEFEFEDDCDCGCHHHHGEDADEDDELKF